MRASAGTLLILGELAGALEQTVFLLPEAASSMFKLHVYIAVPSPEQWAGRCRKK